jgi:GGDEF domain-containing protein
MLAECKVNDTEIPASACEGLFDDIENHYENPVLAQLVINYLKNHTKLCAAYEKIREFKSEKKSYYQLKFLSYIESLARKYYDLNLLPSIKNPEGKQDKNIGFTIDDVGKFNYIISSKDVFLPGPNTTRGLQTYFFEEFIKQQDSEEEFGIMVFDLNKVRLANNAIGREATDDLIAEGFEIIKNKAEDLIKEPKYSKCKITLGRAGGDELKIFFRGNREERTSFYEKLTNQSKLEVGKKPIFVSNTELNPENLNIKNVVAWGLSSKLDCPPDLDDVFQEFNKKFQVDEIINISTNIESSIDPEQAQKLLRLYYYKLSLVKDTPPTTEELIDCIIKSLQFHNSSEEEMKNDENGQNPYSFFQYAIRIAINAIDDFMQNQHGVSDFLNFYKDSFDLNDIESSLAEIDTELSLGLKDDFEENLKLESLSRLLETYTFNKIQFEKLVEDKKISQILHGQVEAKIANEVGYYEGNFIIKRSFDQALERMVSLGLDRNHFHKYFVVIRDFPNFFIALKSMQSIPNCKDEEYAEVSSILSRVNNEMSCITVPNSFAATTTEAQEVLEFPIRLQFLDNPESKLITDYNQVQTMREIASQDGFSIPFLDFIDEHLSDEEKEKVIKLIQQYYEQTDLNNAYTDNDIEPLEYKVSNLGRIARYTFHFFTCSRFPFYSQSLKDRNTGIYSELKDFLNNQNLSQNTEISPSLQDLEARRGLVFSFMQGAGKENVEKLFNFVKEINNNMRSLFGNMQIKDNAAYNLTRLTRLEKQRKAVNRWIPKTLPEGIYGKYPGRI